MPPYQKQETDYYCGPAVVQMALASIGIIFTQAALAEELKTTPEVGTTADAIAALLRQHGLEVKRSNGAAIADIAAALSEGQLAIVGYVAQDEPHYALVSSLGDGAIVLQDPYFGEAHTLPLEEFQQRWRDNEAGMYGDRLLITVS
jgi:ABC-type bacteriocin/lantibiotic exporter with double-glycine peptidase domain